MSSGKQHEPEWLNETIFLESKIDIEFWCKMLGCSESNLRRAVSVMGSSPKAVNSYLELNRLKNHHDI